MNVRVGTRWGRAAVASAVAALVWSCGPTVSRNDFGDGDGDGNGNSAQSDAGPQESAADAALPPIVLFPEEGIVVPPAPANAPDLFGAFAAGPGAGGPCLIEPPDQALFPRNWLRPRFRFSAPAGHNLFELRIEVAGEPNPLVVYTTKNEWIMPKELWVALARHRVDTAIAVSVRSAQYDGSGLAASPVASAPISFAIAPVVAPGSIVYWTTSARSALKGFRVGEETVRDVLQPAQAETGCIGCHSATPDGLFVGFSASANPRNGTAAQFGLRSVDSLAAEPAFVTDNARALLARTYQQQPVFSPAHWSDGDRIALSMFEMNGATEIIWTNLEAASQTQGVDWGVVARIGDTRSAASAAFSHDGEVIAYTSAAQITSGVSTRTGDADVYAVRFADGLGGTAEPVPGASERDYSEYYPAYSPDDTLLAFTRTPRGQSSYNNRQAEVFIVPAAGGQAIRLAANDPPQCSGQRSPGVTNSWPKWAPDVSRHGGRAYYWLVFSSTRGPERRPQMYVTGVVADEVAITSHGAIYLWNQPAAENNHTPAWDSFDIAIGHSPAGASPAGASSTLESTQ
jgi:hypothetical protein